MNPHFDREPDSWSFFDKIYCISLQERQDRRQKARQQFADVGIGNRVEFVIVKKHSENPEKGIFESHRQCLVQGLASGAETILVFEDDVFFRGFSDSSLHIACDQLKGFPCWDVLLLGGITSGSRKTSAKNLTKVRYRCLAHAYAINRSFAQTIVGKKWNGTPWDEMFRLSGGAFYALYPMCAFQGTEGSDNRTIAIDRVRRFFGGLPFIQRTNELYQNHKLLLTAVPVTVFVILAAFFFWI